MTMLEYVCIVVLLVNLSYAQVPGGKSDLEIDDEIKNLTWHAVNEGENKVSNDMYHWIPVKIIKAETQVVSGVMYHLEVLIGQSKCTKNQMSHKEVNAESCSVRDGARYQICKFEVWQQVWRNFERITKKECKNTDKDGKSKSANKPEYGKELLIKSPKHVRKHRKNGAAWSLFEFFKDRFNKAYSNGKREELKRFRIFKKNLRRIKKLQENEKGTAQYGITKFADMSIQEFRRTILTPEWKDVGYPTKIAQIDEQMIYEMPRNFDWRHYNAVTEVKNQGSCGSCWAFSVTGNIEGQWALKKHSLISLSEQELVDCDKLDDGCSGGLPANAYKELLRLGGLEPEKDYPYEGRNDKCHIDKSDIEVYINDSLKLPSDETKMAAWLVKNGPISIGINADAMMFYWHGIAHPWSIFCNPKSLNHGVLIVGYGMRATNPFWIIKNSWGPDWGESGYYLLYRGKGVCGVDQMPTSAIVD